MKVLLFTDPFLPKIGGMELWAFYMASQLVAIGNEVAVVTTTEGRDEDRFDFSVLRFPARYHIFGYPFVFFPLLFAIKKFRPDIVHFQGPSVTERVSIPILRFLGYSSVVTFQSDSGFFSNSFKDRFIRMTSKLAYNFSDCVFVQSRRDFKKLTNRGVAERKIKLMYFNGVDASVFNCGCITNEDSNSFKVVIVAKLDEGHGYKGIDCALKAFSIINESSTGRLMEFEIIGGEDLHIINQYKELSLQLGVRNLTFTGVLSQSDLVEHMCKSHVLILPSTSENEGFGRVVLEAIFCNLIVIVSKYAGISELIKRYGAGFVVDPLDPNQIVEALQTILFDDSVRKRIADFAKSMVLNEGLTLKDATLRTVKTYESLLGK